MYLSDLFLSKDDTDKDLSSLNDSKISFFTVLKTFSLF